MEFNIKGISIEKIYRSDKKQDGTPYMSKKGNAFSKVDIYIDHNTIDDMDFQGKLTYFDYFGNTDDWNTGTPITGIISKTEFNGKTYFNFDMERKSGAPTSAGLEELKERVRKLEEAVFGNGENLTEGAMKFSGAILSKEEKEAKEEKELIEDLPF